METRTIFLSGKPGCGKGTQAKLLAEATGWRVISAGAQFRELAADDTPVGHKVKTEIEAGRLVPYWFATFLFLKELFSVGGDESVIFDGFTRKEHEAELVIDSLQWTGRPFTLLNIIISDDEVRRRITIRKEEENRADDSAVEERLAEYHANTGPAIEKFRATGNLIEINGEQSREAIANDIKTALGIS